MFNSHVKFLPTKYLGWKSNVCFFTIMSIVYILRMYHFRRHRPASALLCFYIYFNFIVICIQNRKYKNKKKFCESLYLDFESRKIMCIYFFLYFASWHIISIEKHNATAIFICDEYTIINGLLFDLFISSSTQFKLGLGNLCLVSCSFVVHWNKTKHNLYYVWLESSKLNDTQNIL